MHSFILNQEHHCQTFQMDNPQCKFTLLEVIPFNTSAIINKDELGKRLAGFYFEIEEMYKIDDDKIYSRSRPFELAKKMSEKDNSIHFKKTILNEIFEVEGLTVFYTILNIHLRRRYETQYDLEFEVRYKHD
jgi:hypothetical protein